MSAVPLRLVVAAYNEGPNLEGLFVRLAAALSGRAWRAFVVDDGSKDDTAAVLARLTAKLPVTPVVHPVNRGIAQVFLSGLRAALAGADEDDAVAILEGDGTSDPALLPAMQDRLSGKDVDVVIASRQVPGGSYRNFPFKRLVFSLAANTMLRAVCGLEGVRDYTIFYRVYRAGPLRRALEANGDAFVSVGGFACNAEMLLRLGPFSRGAAEVPFVYDYGLKKGASSMKLGGNLLSYVRLFRIHAEASRGAARRP